MSGADGVLADAVRAAVADVAGINGAYPGAPVAASAPWGEIVETLATDWSTKDREGREVRLAIRLRDAGPDRARIGRIAADVEVRVSALPRRLGDWRIASLTFLRSRTASEAPGRWVSVIEYRARMLKGDG